MLDVDSLGIGVPLPFFGLTVVQWARLGAIVRAIARRESVVV